MDNTHAEVETKPQLKPKVVRYKIYIQKSLAYLDTNNEKSEREIKESIPLTSATKRITYLGINQSKKTKELHIENYKEAINKVKRQPSE